MFMMYYNKIQMARLKWKTMDQKPTKSREENKTNFLERDKEILLRKRPI